MIVRTMAKTLFFMVCSFLFLYYMIVIDAKVYKNYTMFSGAMSIYLDEWTIIHNGLPVYIMNG